YDVLKDFAGVFIAIAAAYLAYCFQRRQAFLASLRDLWHVCIEAKADIVDYVRDTQPTEEKYRRVQRSISKAIDGMRGVYRNVSETEAAIGLYPFEPLHDMRRELERLGCRDLDAKARHAALKEVIDSWNAFRWSFLREFSTPMPTHHIVG